MKCFTWNLEWTSPSSKRGSLVRKKNLVDHVAGCSRLSISVDRIVPRFAPCETRLFDHPGVVATVASKNEEGGNA